MCTHKSCMCVCEGVSEGATGHVLLLQLFVHLGVVGVAIRVPVREAKAFVSLWVSLDMSSCVNVCSTKTCHFSEGVTPHSEGAGAGEVGVCGCAHEDLVCRW